MNFDAGSACHFKKKNSGPNELVIEKETQMDFEKTCWHLMKIGDFQLKTHGVAAVNYFQFILLHNIPFNLPSKDHLDQIHQFSRLFAPSV